MLVLVVAAILFGYGVPQFGRIIQSQRLSGQINDLVADLATARAEAIRRAAFVTVCKTTDPNPSSGDPACSTTDANPWTTGRLIFVDTNGNGVLDAGEELLRVRQALDGSTASSANRLLGDGAAAGSANKITYRSDGTTTLTGEVELRLCDSRGFQFGRAVVVQRAGRTRLAEPGKNMTNGTLSCT